MRRCPRWVSPLVGPAKATRRMPVGRPATPRPPTNAACRTADVRLQLGQVSLLRGRPLQAARAKGLRPRAEIPSTPDEEAKAPARSPARAARTRQDRSAFRRVRARRGHAGRHRRAAPPQCRRQAKPSRPRLTERPLRAPAKSKSSAGREAAGNQKAAWWAPPPTERNQPCRMPPASRRNAHRERRPMDRP